MLLRPTFENPLFEPVKHFLHTDSKVVTDKCTYQYQEVQIKGDLSKVVRPQKIIQDI
jgi:hypothetical protein